MTDPDESQPTDRQPDGADETAAAPGGPGARFGAEEDEPDVEPFAGDRGTPDRNGSEHGYGYE